MGVALGGGVLRYAWELIDQVADLDIAPLRQVFNVRLSQRGGVGSGLRKDIIASLVQGLVPLRDLAGRRGCDLRGGRRLGGRRKARHAGRWSDDTSHDR